MLWIQTAQFEFVSLRDNTSYVNKEEFLQNIEITFPIASLSIWEIVKEAKLMGRKQLTMH